eukprot:9146353-Pyramimonas_sp.AAC.2
MHTYAGKLSSARSLLLLYNHINAMTLVEGRLLGMSVTRHSGYNIKASEKNAPSFRSQRRFVVRPLTTRLKRRCTLKVAMSVSTLQIPTYPSQVEYFTSPHLFDEELNLTHGFFTRRGGTSEGLFASLNCGRTTKDDSGNIGENRARAAMALGIPPDALVGVKQIHSAKALVVDATNIEAFHNDSVEADALVTCQPGIALGVLGADCAPVLFHDATHGVIGAAHAGWKGAVGGVLEATVNQMVSLGASADTIRAAVGPCVGPKSYEVGPEFVDQFLAQKPTNKAFFKPSQRAGHSYFDLPGYIEERLKKAGVHARCVLPNKNHLLPVKALSPHYFPLSYTACKLQ